MTPIVDTTFGALLLGGFCAAALSGIVAVQTFLYIKLFPNDNRTVKAIVATVWVLDTSHSLLVYASTWVYMITNFGNVSAIDTISTPLAMTVILTGILTFIVHCFFSHRIHKLSRNQWRVTMLIVILAFLRLCAASVSTAEMIHVKTFTAFEQQFRWIFTLGLALSCLVDCLVAGFLTYSLQSLQTNRTASSSLDRVISAVILYTFETNLLTSAATIVSMICWLTMPTNLVFMGLHFFISKLYANSLLATLNTRKQLQYERERGVSADLPTAFPRFSTTGARRNTGIRSSPFEPPTPTKLEINIEKTVEYEVDTQSPSLSHFVPMDICEPTPSCA